MKKSHLALIILCVTGPLFGQSPSVSYSLGVPLLNGDPESAFGWYGAKDGGLDGVNLTGSVELSEQIHDQWYAWMKANGYFLQCPTSAGRMTLQGLTGQLGLGYQWQKESFKHALHAGIGMGMLQTKEKAGTSTSILNPGLYTWGSLSAPTSLGYRLSKEMNSQTYFVDQIGRAHV